MSSASSYFFAAAGGMLMASGLYYGHPSTFVAGVFIVCAALTR